MSFCPSTSLLKLYFAILSIPPDPSVSRNAAKVDDALPLTPSKSTCLRHHVPEVKEIKLNISLFFKCKQYYVQNQIKVPKMYFD